MTAVAVPAAAARRAGQGAALDQVTRTMALALGVGTVVFVVLSVGSFAAQYSSFSPIWSWGVLLTTFIPPLVAAIFSGTLRTRVIRNLLSVAACSYLAGLLLLVPAITTADGKIPPEVASPWILGVSAVGTCAAAVAWRPAFAWAYLAACVVTLGVDRVLASRENLLEIAIQDAAYTMLFDAIFAALAMATARAGRLLDIAADRAFTETRSAAATEAASRERSRIDSLVHDSVLVALLASARGAPRAAREARVALERLDEADQPSASHTVSSQAWLWRVQAITTDLAPTARFSHESGDAALSLPAPVADALVEATAEAIRNSVQHAGPASRAVHVTVSESEVEVTVIDDGIGFDAAKVSGARLGVAVSILDRMRALPGGRAAIVSRPGVGTRVAVGWRSA
jgi:signal transduction histidine kinase